MNDVQKLGILILIVYFSLISIFSYFEIGAQTRLLEQQIEISQQINQKLKILMLRGK